MVALSFALEQGNWIWELILKVTPVVLMHKDQRGDFQNPQPLYSTDMEKRTTSQAEKILIEHQL